MYVVIVGLGQVGQSLAGWLMGAQHEVAVVDWNAARCVAVDDRLGNVSVVGDGTEASVLAKAGTNRADIFIAATGRDDANLVACQIARHRFGVSRTLSLVGIPDHEALFSLLGIDATVSTTELTVDSVKRQMAGLMAEDVGGPR